MSVQKPHCEYLLFVTCWVICARLSDSLWRCMGPNKKRLSLFFTLHGTTETMLKLSRAFPSLCVSSLIRLGWRKSILTIPIRGESEDKVETPVATKMGTISYHSRVEPNATPWCREACKATVQSLAEISKTPRSYFTTSLSRTRGRPASRLVLPAVDNKTLGEKILGEDGTSDLEETLV